jgi:hypothetical protein
MTHIRKRAIYFALILVNIPAGLATRKYGNYLPQLVAQYGGDTLYASLIFFGLRLLIVEKKLWQIALWAYAVCVLIEVQQLYRAPWAVQLRKITIIRLIFGEGFLWSDLVCYAVGVFIGWLIATLLKNNRK